MNIREIEQQVLKLQAETDRSTADNELKKLLAAASNKTAWDIVQLARHPHRPKALDLMEQLFTQLHEMHGDRYFGDDGALWGGIGYFHNQPVTVLAQMKGHNLNENIKCNFGMMNPEGYRKAMRLARQAAKFKRPIINIVDTSGAYPGKGAEERGQAQAIAECLKLFSDLPTVVITIVLSEGGSGGALALSVSDYLVMCENATYSILSPEGFASILFKDDSRVIEASELMGLTAKDLHAKGIVDEIIKEHPLGMHHHFNDVVRQIDLVLMQQLTRLNKYKVSVLLNKRQSKFRKLGAVNG
jgi:acetyl-CoA carboxylase carboxyl transferase subunit alpha